MTCAWFAYGLSIDPANRLRGDAMQYLRIALSFHSLGEAVGYTGTRTFGFPLFLYVMRGIVGLDPTSPASVQTFLAAVAIVLLVVHLAACTAFFVAVRTVVARELRVDLHPIALALLLAHPTLATHASVALTDTLGADLLMLGTALLVAADAGRGTRGRLAVAAAGGFALGGLVVVRPASLVVVVTVLGAAAVQVLVVARQRRAIVAATAAACAIVVGWQAWTCGTARGRICLIDPAAADAALGESIAWGTTSARHYWSSHSSEPDARVVVADGFLARHLAAHCTAHALGGADGLLACLASRPWVVPAFVVKKAIGLFDAYQLQPYAVDVTPRWVRLATRPFGALAFAGFVCALGWLVRVALRRPPPFPGDLTVLVMLVPVVHVVWQSLFHVEPRYGFAAVPFAIVALVLTLRVARTATPPAARLIVGGVALAATLFGWQTHRWDVDDRVLRRIERW